MLNPHIVIVLKCFLNSIRTSAETDADVPKLVQNVALHFFARH